MFEPETYTSQVFLDTSKNHPTYEIFWYPIKVHHPDPQKPHEVNLYAEGGPLEKYDAAFKAKSKEYELKHNYQPDDPNIRPWEGHCDSAAITMCLLRKEPKKEVTHNGVKFTPHDIKGLLCKVISSVSFDYSYVGWRYPDKDRDTSDPGQDPEPSKVYKQLSEWKKEKLQVPIVCDVDPYMDVWNYAFSGLQWVMQTPTKGYLHATSVGQPEENKLWWFDMEKDAWVPGPDDPKDYLESPDFIWRPVANVDLLKEESWPVEPLPKMNPFHNPEVSPRNVYKLYIKSILTDEQEEKQRDEEEKRRREEEDGPEE